MGSDPLKAHASHKELQGTMSLAKTAGRNVLPEASWHVKANNVAVLAKGRPPSSKRQARFSCVAKVRQLVFRMRTKKSANPWYGLWKTA